MDVVLADVLVDVVLVVVVTGLEVVDLEVVVEEVGFAVVVGVLPPLLFALLKMYRQEIQYGLALNSRYTIEYPSSIRANEDLADRVPARSQAVRTGGTEPMLGVIDLSPRNTLICA